MTISLRQRLGNWLLRTSDDEAVKIGMEQDAYQDELDIDHDSAFHFSVIPASGGRIVKIRYYDRVKDRNCNKLHIITPDEKLEEALAHIFQIETLSR